MNTDHETETTLQSMAACIAGLSRDELFSLVLHLGCELSQARQIASGQALNVHQHALFSMQQILLQIRPAKDFAQHGGIEKTLGHPLH